jgi:hypothetical protein
MKFFQTAYPPALSARGARMFVQDSLGNHVRFHKFQCVRFLHYCRRSQLTPWMQLRAGIPFVAVLLRCSTEVALLFFSSWRSEFLFVSFFYNHCFAEWLLLLLYFKSVFICTETGSCVDHARCCILEVFFFLTNC